MQQRRRQLRDVGDRFAYPWIMEVGRRYKERGIFPLSLCDYYTTKEDIEIAAIVELLFPYAKREQYILEVRNILGGNLWDMLKTRSFFKFSDVEYEDKLILGYPKLSVYRLFNVLDWVWGIMVEKRMPLDFALAVQKGKKEELEDVVDYKDFRYRYDMLLMKLATADGYGIGIWDRFKRLSCPINEPMICVLRQFYPIETVTIKNAQAIIRFLGFKRTIDFLYAYWGYERLRKTMPKEIAHFEQTFPNRLTTLHKSSFTSESSDKYLREDIPGDIIFD